MNGEGLRQSQELRFVYMFLIKAGCHNFRDYSHHRHVTKGIMSSGIGLRKYNGFAAPKILKEDFCQVYRLKSIAILGFE